MDGEGGKEGMGGGPLLFPALDGSGGGPRALLPTAKDFTGIGGGPRPPLTVGNGSVDVLAGGVADGLVAQLSFFPAKQLSHTRCFFLA